MELTPNYNLKKPAGNENIGPGAFNDNANIIDEQLKNLADEKLGTTGDGKDVTVTFVQAATRENISSGEKFSVILGKIKKWFADLGTAALCQAEAFASASHIHAAGDVTSGTLGLARGGTGSGTAAGARTNLGAASKIEGTATLATANWTGSAAPYQYALTIAGLTADDKPHVDRVTGTDAAAAALINTAWGLIAGYAVKPQTSANTITFYASAIPAVAIPIMYEAVRS